MLFQPNTTTKTDKCQVRNAEDRFYNSASLANPPLADQASCGSVSTSQIAL